jgi:hypothetical protein
MMVVESCAFTVPAAPPDTLTMFTCGDVAFEATLTVTVMDGQLWPAASESLLVATGPPGKDQPEPVMDANVSPAGSVSATVTFPPVAAFPTFVTVIVYVAFCWPC